MTTTRTTRDFCHALGTAALALALSACGNNVGRLFDPGGPGNGGGNGPDDATGITAVPVGSFGGEGRPGIVDAFPKGSGWAVTTPVVVVFDEAMARDTVFVPGGSPIPGVPNLGGTSRILVRVTGTTQDIPGTVDFLFGDRVAVFRPAAALQPEASYDVLVDTEVTDVDGTRLGGTEPEVFATFTPDLDETVEDAQVVAALPIDNARNVVRSSAVALVFDKPADPATITTASFRVDALGAPLNGELDYPVQVSGVPDPRVVRFTPGELLPAATEVQVTVDGTIAFGDNGGRLDFSGRSPFARFETVQQAPPTDVRIGNPPAGYPQQVNASNVSNLIVDVDYDDSVPVGARVLARIYGLEPETEFAGDLNFVEARGEITTAGPGTVSVEFLDALGDPANLRFEEGPLTLRVEFVASRASSGVAGTSGDVEPRIDVTAPTIDGFVGGLPGSSTDLATDLEVFALHGRASEPLGTVELTIDGNPAVLFGTNDDGAFAFQPVAFGRRRGAAGYVLSAVDRSGNAAPMAVNGQIAPRGFVTEPGATGLVVEVYDAATFAPLPAARVQFEPGLPTSPRAAGAVQASVDAAGRVDLGTVPAGLFTVTAVADGYGITTIAGVDAGFVSIPLSPIGATESDATVSGRIAFDPSGGRTAVIGINTLADPVNEVVATATGQPVELDPATVLPNRPLAISGFAGVFPLADFTGLTGFFCQLCGPDLTTPTAGIVPPGVGESAEFTAIAAPVERTLLEIPGGFSLDFAAAEGLAALAGTPDVRVVASLGGFPGVSLIGLGRATPTAGEAFQIAATLSLPGVAGLAALAPVYWVSTTAVDGDGAVSRHRQLIVDPNVGTTFGTWGPPGIATPSGPAGGSDGAPEITVADRLDPAIVPGGNAVRRLVLRDPAGRAWQILWPDRDGAGGSDVLQVPILDGLGLVGLATGTWTVESEATVFFSLTATPDDFAITELVRQPVTFSRSARVAVEVR